MSQWLLLNTIELPFLPLITILGRRVIMCNLFRCLRHGKLMHNLENTKQISPWCLHKQKQQLAIGIQVSKRKQPPHDHHCKLTWRGWDNLHRSGPIEPWWIRWGTRGDTRHGKLHIGWRYWVKHQPQKIGKCSSQNASQGSLYHKAIYKQKNLPFNRFLPIVLGTFQFRPEILHTFPLSYHTKHTTPNFPSGTPPHLNQELHSFHMSFEGCQSKWCSSLTGKKINLRRRTPVIPKSLIENSSAIRIHPWHSDVFILKWGIH